MATLADVNPVIPGDGWVYVAEPGTTAPTADQIEAMDLFDPSGTLPEWTWIGDTSWETPIEFEEDGGDAESKRTWPRRNLRMVREAKTVTMTIASVNISTEMMQLAFPNGSHDAASGTYWAPQDDVSVERAVLVVWQDAGKRGAFIFPKVDLAGSFPTFDHEEFMEIPLAGAVLDDPDAPGRFGLITKAGMTPLDAADPVSEPAA